MEKAHYVKQPHGSPCCGEQCRLQQEERFQGDASNGRAQTNSPTLHGKATDEPFSGQQAAFMAKRQISPLILIVDDDTTTTVTLHRLLRSAGFETLCAHNLSDAGTMASDNPVSMILLDVHLPDGIGLDLCRRMRSSHSTSGVPILFISSNDDIDMKVKGFEAGAVDYITKPLVGVEVLARVRTHLRLRQAYEQLEELQAERIHSLTASQKSLMPVPENLPEANFQACIREVLKAGGDFYDVLRTGNRTFDYIVADASGHNLGTSLWTASLKTSLAEHASVLNSPSDICRMINNSLRRILPDGAYFTAIYARLNRLANRLQIINTGHPSAILVSARNGQPRVLQQEGDVLGVYPDAVFGEMELPVEPGDRIYLYSDGLVEIDGSRDEGISKLLSLCAGSMNIPLSSAVSAIVDSMCAKKNVHDDTVMLGVCV